MNTHLPIAGGSPTVWDSIVPAPLARFASYLKLKEIILWEVEPL